MAKTAKQTEPIPKNIRNTRKWKSGKAEQPLKSNFYRVHLYRQKRVPFLHDKNEQSQGATRLSGGTDTSKNMQPDK